MKKLLLTSVILSACAQDIDTSSLRKGEVDASAMRDGVEVVLDGALATVSVPFSTPAPDVPEAEFHDEMEHAVRLRIVSLRSGAAAEAADGEALSWSVTAARDEAVLEFDQAVSGGLVLDPRDGYTAHFSVAANDYVRRVGAMVLDVRVVAQ
jgi:hypothetical protein